AGRSWRPESLSDIWKYEVPGPPSSASPGPPSVLAGAAPAAAAPASAAEPSNGVMVHQGSRRLPAAARTWVIDWNADAPRSRGAPGRAQWLPAPVLAAAAAGSFARTRGREAPRAGLRGVQQAWLRRPAPASDTRCSPPRAPSGASAPTPPNGTP